MCKDDSEDDDDADSDQQVVEGVKVLQQEQLSDDVSLSDTQVTAELPMPGPDGSTEDESGNSDSGSDDEMELSQQNHLRKPHRDPIVGDQASGIDKKSTVVDPTIVRKHVKRTLLKKQKSQHRPPPAQQGSNKKVRKQHSKRKQVPDYF